MQPENLDDFIRKRLQRFKPAKPAEDALWANIAGALDQQRRPWYGRHNSIPAAMFLAFTVVLSYTGSLQVDKDQLAMRDGIRNSEFEIRNSESGIGNTGKSGRNEQLAERTHHNKTQSIQDELYNSQRPNANVFHGQGTVPATGSKGQFGVHPTQGSSPKTKYAARSTRFNGRMNADFASTTQFAALSAQYSVRNTPYAVRRTENGLNRIDVRTAALSNQGNILAAAQPYRTKDEKRIARAAGNNTGQWSDWQNINYQSWNNAAVTASTEGYTFTWHDRMSYVQDGPAGEYQDQFALEARVPGSKLGAGVYYGRFQRPFSFLSNISTNLSYPVLNFGGGELRAGLSGVLMQKELFGTYLVYQDQFSPTGEFIKTSQEKYFTSTQRAFGVNAGLFYSNGTIMAGFSADNLNTPDFGVTQNGERLGREYSAALGYKMRLGTDLQVMPWAELRTTSLTTTLSGSLLAVYKNRFMIGISEQNIDASTLKGEISCYAGVEFKSRYRLFASYGKNMELARHGIPQRIFHAGIRIHLSN